MSYFNHAACNVTKNSVNKTWVIRVKNIVTFGRFGFVKI